MSKEKKIFQLEKKEICITSSQIKQAIDLLVNENEISQEEIKRLNNIFNQIEEYISSLELGSDRAYYNKEGYEVDVKDILKMMKELKGEDK